MMRIIRLSLIIPLLGCGAKSGLIFDRSLGDGGPSSDAGQDAGADAGLGPRDGGLDGGDDAGLDASGPCVPVEPACLALEVCGNGSDDNCDGAVDEGCDCAPGAVQGCFDAPPGSRNVGVCTDGSQVCEASRRWGPCTGAILPREDVCNGADNLCNGCSAQRDCPILCPEPGDPRVAVGTPFSEYELDGRLFYEGPVATWRWTVRGGPCDDIAPNLESFELRKANEALATLFPRLSGDYTVRLEVVTANGSPLSCEWVAHVAGPGLRVEMCYPESEEADLDLYLHRPDSVTDWFPSDLSTAFEVNGVDVCGWHNCEAEIRGQQPNGDPWPRVDWGYPESDLEQCSGGPHGAEWADLGMCANPRLDIDNNLSKASGVPENINLDVPRDGDTFRIMVQNFTGTAAHPVVNIYCGGHRVATYGADPDPLEGFRGRDGTQGLGAMWRVADVTTFVDADGTTIDCDSEQLHPPGEGVGYDISTDEARY